MSLEELANLFDNPEDLIKAVENSSIQLEKEKDKSILTDIMYVYLKHLKNEYKSNS